MENWYIYTQSSAVEKQIDGHNNVCLFANYEIKRIFFM